MKSIRFTIACCAIACLAPTTARAVEYEYEEEEEIWCSEDVWITDGDGYGGDGDSGGESGSEVGWGVVEWITPGDPGTCRAEACSAHCTFTVYPCETGQCGDIIWPSCFAIDCYDFNNCG